MMHSVVENKYKPINLGFQSDNKGVFEESSGKKKVAEKQGGKGKKRSVAELY